ncbi:hypothetical protein KPATCC21470_5692 [Kitasatospora purpeofusca]
MAAPVVPRSTGWRNARGPAEPRAYRSQGSRTTAVIDRPTAHRR